MPVSDLVNISISRQTAGISGRANFGKPMILGCAATFGELSRTYSTLAAMVTDGFATTSPEYLAASAILSQSPHITSWVVGRRTNKPAMNVRLTPVAVNAFVYSIKINGTEVSYTSDANATVAEITAGLKTAIDALAVANLTTTDNNTSLDLTMASGKWIRVQPTLAPQNRGNLLVAQTNADGGIATDLAAIQLVDNTWGALINVFASKAEILAAAAWCETAQVELVQLTQDTIVATTTGGADTTSIAYAAKAYAFTNLYFHTDNGAFLDAGIAGKCLTYTPGSETWHLKALSGVESLVFTDTQETNLEAKNVNYYTAAFGSNFTIGGKAIDGEFTDIIRGIVYLQFRLNQRIGSRLADNSVAKLPYTDRGIAAIEAEVRAQMTEEINLGFLTDDPAPTVSAPLAKDVSDADKAARTLNGVSFVAHVAGAIHAATITGRVTL